MAKTLQDKAYLIADKFDLPAEAVTITRTGKRSVIKVQLPNGRNISVDSVDGWEAALEKNIRKFINKKDQPSTIGL